jgi:hypothetical protein
MQLALPDQTTLSKRFQKDLFLILAEKVFLRRVMLSESAGLLEFLRGEDIRVKE